MLRATDGVQPIVQLQGDTLITGTSQDCTAIVEDAQARHKAGFHGTSEMKHAARIPDVIVEKYCNLNGIEFAEFMANPIHVKRICNDPSLSAFRIWPGRV